MSQVSLRSWQGWGGRGDAPARAASLPGHAVKESNPREGWELPCLRSRSTRSTSAPGAGEPPRQLSPDSPPAVSPVPSSTGDPAVPFLTHRPSRAGRYSPPGSGPSGFTVGHGSRLCAGGFGLSWGWTAPAQAPGPKKLKRPVSWAGAMPPRAPGTAAPLSPCSLPHGASEVTWGSALSPAPPGSIPSATSCRGGCSQTLPQPPQRGERAANLPRPRGCFHAVRPREV